MSEARRWLASWSPWKLRAALRAVRFMADEDLFMVPDDRVNTTLVQLVACAGAGLSGARDPLRTAVRYSVKDRSLCIDATTSGVGGEQSTMNARPENGEPRGS